MASTNLWTLPKTGRIGIIGAGIAGLGTANRLIRSGYKNVTIFDRKSEQGGVWGLPYPGLYVHNPVLAYYFPEYKYNDFEENESIFSNISGYRMNKYINKYIRYNNTQDIIQLNTSVDLLQYDQDTSKWKANITKNYNFISDYDINTENNSNTEQTEEEFDFVIVCSGLNHIPKIKKNEIKNYDKFNGKMYYPFELNEDIVNDIIKNGKNVLVVGGSKSAREIASLFAEQYEDNGMHNIVHNVDPDTKWNVPIPYTVFGRDFGGPPLVAPFMSLLTDEQYLKLSFTEKIQYNIGYLKRWYHYRLLNLSSKQNTPRHIWYDKPFDKMKSSFVIVEPLNGFNDRVKKKQIDVHKTRFDGFDAKGHIKLENNEYLNRNNIDVVVLGIGWNLSFPLLKNNDNDLDKIILKGSGTEQQYSDNLLLHRYCINPSLPQMAFNGCVTGFDHFVQNYFVSCYILNLMQNKVRNIPNHEQMMDDVQREIQWREENGFDGNYFLDPLRVPFYKAMINDLNLQQKTQHWFGANQSFSANYLETPENYMYHVVPFEE